MKKIWIVALSLPVLLFGADSLNVCLLGRFTPCSPLGIAVEGNVAFLANSSGGLQILDVTNPSSIASSGYLFLPGDATGIATVGDYVAMACSDSTLRILDPTVPSDIEILGELASDAQIERCFAIGDTVYATGGKFSIIDVSVPAAPVEIGVFPDVFGASGIFVKPPYSYLAEDHYGLSIVDISNPAFPVSDNRYFGLEEYVRSVCIDRYNRIFIGTDEELMIYRHLGDSIEELGSWVAPDNVLDIEVDGIYAFLACGASGLRIIDISNPSAIAEVGYYVLGSELTDIFLDYPRAWLVGLWARVNVFDISLFQSVEEREKLPGAIAISTYPNPFNSACRIDGPKGRAKIFNTAGRVVDEIEIPGIWSPGKNIPSGIYLVKVKGTNSTPAKAVLMR